MGEYCDRYTVSNLIGSPPGYVGHGEGGVLTNFVRDNRSCLVVLDDIDLAHQSLQDLLQGALSNGKVRDMEDREVDFSGVLFILTSNAGSSTLSKGIPSIGFSGSTSDVRSRVVEESMSIFSDKLRDRVGKPTLFNSLSRDDIRKIVHLELAILNSVSIGPTIRMKDGAVDVILHDWKDGEGARKIKRILEDRVVKVVAQRYLEDGTISSISVDGKDGELVFRYRRVR
jgi:ATP-dependent Clp protease ATP-binding subunit ClpA